MSQYGGRREFRPGLVILLITIGVTLLFATGAVMTWRDRGWSWVSAGLAGFTLFSVAGIVETLVLRVRLDDDALVVTDLRGSRSYPRAEIADVGQGKGVPTSIRLANGRWVKLPMVGSEMGNSIRSWLKHG